MSRERFGMRFWWTVGRRFWDGLFDTLDCDFYDISHDCFSVLALCYKLYVGESEIVMRIHD